MFKYLINLLFSWTTRPILLLSFWDIVTILLEAAFVNASIYIVKYFKSKKGRNYER